MTQELSRCGWTGLDPLMAAYHDDVWGKPCHDDRELFELLMLDCFQAGLSWQIILRKRESFFKAFDGWDARKIAAYGPDDVARLLADPGIVRNRLKVAAAVGNAKAFLALQDEFGSFDAYLWGAVPGAPLRSNPPPQSLGELPARTPESDALSKNLKKRGFNFVGTTIVYAFMQSVGLVNDHLAGPNPCWRAPEVDTSR